MAGDECPLCIGLKKGAHHPEVVADVIIFDTPAPPPTVVTLTTLPSLQRCIFYSQYYVLHAISKMAAPLSLYIKKQRTYCLSAVTSEWRYASLWTVSKNNLTKESQIIANHTKLNCSARWERNCRWLRRKSCQSLSIHGIMWPCCFSMSLWRNWLARSAVNRKDGGSSPPRDVCVLLACVPSASTGE